MTINHLSEVIQQLHRTVLLRDGEGLTDGQVLECFIRHQDEAAFALLVRRHGPMVLGVCRRLLGNSHDAEDAFQAAFLVLVRKAASIVPRERVGNWLYGVARTTAIRARALATRRQLREKHLPELPERAAAAPEPDAWSELRPVLDEAVSRLPDKYRAPVVLCDLEGQTIQEAAHRLGWPQGTVAGRLARARTLLAKRLARYGVGVSAGSLAAVLAEAPAAGAVPPAVVSATVAAAAEVTTKPTAGAAIAAPVAGLVEGVLKSMWLTKIKFATAALLVGCLLIASGGLAWHAAAAREMPAGEGRTTAAGRHAAYKKTPMPIADNDRTHLTSGPPASVPEQSDPPPQAPASPRDLALIADAIEKLTRDILKKEADYARFRESIRLLSGPALTRVEKRLEAIATILERHQIRLAEIESLVDVLSQPKTNKNPKALFMLISRMPGGEALQKLSGGKADPDLKELADQFAESLRLELQMIRAQDDALERSRAKLESELREVERFREEDRRRKDELARAHRMFEPIITRLEEMKLLAELKNAEKPKK